VHIKRAHSTLISEVEVSSQALSAAAIEVTVSVIIINYNSVAVTRACLRSLLASSVSPALEIIVIDNASYDGCDKMIESEFPMVSFIQSETNIGFAGANNLGISMASGKYILFLNPDTEVEALAIEKLRDSLAALPTAGIVGARLLNSDRSIQTTSVTAFPSIMNQLLGAEWLRQRLPRLSLWGMRSLFDESVCPVEVEAVSGACLMSKREVVDQVGGFSDDYFMYAEDLDLCWKSKNAGWAVYHVPQALIVHHGGQSSKSRPESSYADLMIRESVHKFMRLRQGRWYAGTFRCVTALVALCRLVLLTVIMPVASIFGSTTIVIKKWLKWAHVFSWCLGAERWVGREQIRSRKVESFSTAL
jgi:N-acetylglucosaminyl-diphospho-decaprenol L-rhamnosyltransferase